MKEGMWYKIVDPVNAPNYPCGSEVKLRVGDFWVLAGDDGSDMPWFDPVSGAGCYLKKHRFDPTPYIRKASGRFAPEKEDSVKEGKFYRCINGGHFVEEGEFCEMLINDGSAAFKYQTRRGPKWIHNSAFDLTTPYDTPPKKENTMIEGKWYKCIESGSGVEAGKYYQCTGANLPGFETPISRFVNAGGMKKQAYNRRFDPTPHDKTVFPNAPDLLERVRRIDPAAAEWLEFGDHSKVPSFKNDRRDIYGIMIWSESPQGHSYWERIHDAVDYEEETPVAKDDFKKGDRVEVRDEDDEDWEPATFLCMDEESEFKYVAKPFGVADGFRYCRRPAPKRPHIEPGTPIEVWDDDGEKLELRRFGCWTGARTWVVRDSDDIGWKHCRVLAPTGVEV